MPQSGPQLWLADIVSAFRHLEDEPGEVVWLQNVYDWIMQHRPVRPKNFDAVVRSTIYHHSSDSDAFVPGYPDVFRKVAHGGWALRLATESVPSKSTDLRTFVLAQMDREEIARFAGKGNEFLDEIDRRVQLIKEKFGLA